MKRFIATSFVLFLLSSMVLSGCGKKSESSMDAPVNDVTVVPDQYNEVPTQVPSDGIIRIWNYTNELPKLVKKFQELHPEYKDKIEIRDASTMEVDYQTLLDQALAAGGDEAPDIYGVEVSFASKYTQGEAYQHAAPYADLGINVDPLLKEAAIVNCFTDLGTNPDGKLVGLGYQSTGGAFIYRRSIAKAVWGTDDPTKIKDIIGPGWDKFFEAATTLKQKNYAICSSLDDVWKPVFGSADLKWVMNGKLVIDSKREDFLDMAKKLKDSGFINNTISWTDEWYNDMNDKGKRKVFGYFGPSWLIGYTMTSYAGGEKGKGTFGDWAICEPPAPFFWGGTLVLANKDTSDKEDVGKIIQWMTLDTSESGLQYLWANDKLDLGIKDTVTSASVMKNSDGKVDFLGGQNIFNVFLSAANNATSRNVTNFDDLINGYWLEQVRQYADGKKTKEQAIDDFKQEVAGNLDIVVE